MKNFIIVACLIATSLITAQKIAPNYSKAGDLVKVTYFYNNGNVQQEGFFKNKKLHGTWKSYDNKGNKTAIAQYENGKKTGKWFIWNKKNLKEINYFHNEIVSVQNWNEGTRFAVK